MSIIKQKKEIFGNIAALKTLNGGLPNLSLSNSISSINNGKSSMNFLMDLLKSLDGLEEIQNILVNILTFELDKIEANIKSELKLQVKGFVNCGINPSIPNFLLHGSTGVQLEVRKIDINDIFLIDPNSDLGVMFYNDVVGGINSTDFNTFLSKTIQDPNSVKSWGASTMGTNILSVEFQDIGSPNNNVIKVTASPEYSSGNKTLTDLNNDYIDSVKLFNTKELVPNIIDSVFGTISSTINKSRESIEKEVRFETIINSIINTNDDDEITDNYFEFDAITNKEVEKMVNNKKEGKIKLNINEGVSSTIPVKELRATSTALEAASGSPTQTKQVLSSKLDTLSNFSAENANGLDRFNVKMDFIEVILKKLMNAISNTLFGPKMIFLLAWNHQIVHGLGSTFEDPEDFMKQNKVLMRAVLNSVRDAIIQIILKIVLEKITKLVSQNIQTILTEKANNASAQLLSLVGVPQEIIRKIQGLV